MADEIDREAVKQAVRAAARDEGRQCPTCQGDGRIPGGQRSVHCRGAFTGADWSEDLVLAAVDGATKVEWTPGAFLGHELAVQMPAGTTWHFDVKAPTVASESAVQ